MKFAVIKSNHIKDLLHWVFYTLKALYFKNTSVNTSKLSSIIVKKIYKHINQNGVIRQIYSVMAKINIGLISFVEGMRLFVKNKDFRSDLWNHKSEVVRLFMSDQKSKKFY